MTKGRTAWQILTGTNKQLSIADSIINPLEVRVGSHVTINRSLSDVELTSDELWQITEIWAWDRNINGQKYPLTDYIIESDDKRLVIRVVPSHDKKHHILIMNQYYPDTPGPLSWNDESQFILDAINDNSGEFYRNRGEENEEKYWRIGGIVPIICDVKILRDQNKDKIVSDNEVQNEPFTLWDFHRVTIKDEVEVTQYLYLQLSGHYQTLKNGDSRIVDGDKSILMLRGEEIEPAHVTIF